MAGRWEPYEDLTLYPVDAAKRERMFGLQLECAVIWSTSAGWPVGVMHWFVWHDDAFWVTVHKRRKRLRAFAARPRTTVIVSSVGTELGPAQSATAKTIATIHDDAGTKDWFFPALAAKAHPADPPYAEQFEQMLRQTDRVVVELRPVEWISYDATKMWQAVQAEGGVHRRRRPPSRPFRGGRRARSPGR